MPTGSIGARFALAWAMFRRLLTNGIFLVWTIAIAVAVRSAIHAFDAHQAGAKDIWDYLIIFGWILGPPTFYLIDAQRRLVIDVPPTETEKYFLDSATKFWAAYLVLLGVIYSG